MHIRLPILALVLLPAGVALADVPSVPIDPAVEAEYVRLHQEIASLAENDHWEGVERAYLKAVATGVPLAFDDQMAGASASQALGDVAHARERLLAARELHEDDPHVIESLWALDTSFAPVKLKAEPGSELTVAIVPFQPDQAHAIEFASVKLVETGLFEGYLPAGSYSLAGQTFEVAVREIGADPIVVDTLGDAPPPKKQKRR